MHRFLILISLFPNLILAQLAPNFTVTDFEGTEINLYEDLLDQGQTVVLEFFFLDCVPCIDISPNMELFYQDWGSGEGEMEMLSISHEDDDLSIAEYATANGLNFPMIGIDGGGLEVFEEFSSGTYGEFLGHPTFVIIAPDRTMLFNPIEDDIEMMISVNAALEDIVEAGTVSINQAQTVDVQFVLRDGVLQVSSSQQGQLRVTDMSGRVMFNTNIVDQITNINLPTGMSMVSFLSNNGLFTKPFFLP